MLDYVLGFSSRLLIPLVVSVAPFGQLLCWYDGQTNPEFWQSV
jgi:hypothetical protein